METTQSQSSILKTTPLSLPNSLPFRTAYGPKLSVTLNCLPGVGRTKQSFAGEADVNNIVAKFIKTGTLDFARKHEARYGDVTGADFQAAQNIIATANSMFEEMPARVRARFENDPAKFLDFVQDPGNQAEAAELGLTVPSIAPGGPVATPPAPAAAAAPVARQEPQNRTEDGRFTFDKPPSGGGR